MNRIVGRQALNDTLRIQTHRGDDMVSVAAVVFGLVQVVVDLGPGEWPSREAYPGVQLDVSAK